MYGKHPPGDSFKTANAAGIAAIENINQTSIKENKEYAGRIYRNADGTFSFTEPVPGGPSGSKLGPKPPGKTIVGDYHTHAAYDPKFDKRKQGGLDLNEEFSSADKKGIDKQGSPGYLGTPRGFIKKYTPIPGKPEKGKIEILKEGKK